MYSYKKLAGELFGKSYLALGAFPVYHVEKAGFVRDLPMTGIEEDYARREYVKQVFASEKQYEETEKYNLTSITARPEIDGLIFYRPTRGMISSPFNAETKHFGTDIAANPGESVLATLDGTVILSTYTAETGYLIEIQHNQDVVSVYKHGGSLLKREGDAVQGGEAIALVGNTGELSTGPHLHFELWHKGRAVNPELYIVF